MNDWKYSVGFAANYAQYKSNAFSVVRKEIRNANGDVVQPPVIYQYDTRIDLVKGGAFIQVSRRFDRVNVSGGVRSDFNSFTNTGNNPLNTLSPRLALSFALNNKWNVNASAGQYFKLPAYTTLGFQNQESFANKDVKYIKSVHYVSGFEYLPSPSLRFTLEGFYKRYSNYPVSVLNGASLANFGTQFGQVGNEPVQSSGNGRAYGAELFAQQKLTNTLFFTVSYTWFKSEFSGANGEFKPSSWDNRNLLSAMVGKKFGTNWELGLKFRYAGPSPYTPFDLAASQLNYLSVGEGIPDYTQVNSQRLNAFKQIDLRVDKKWNFRQTTIDVFIDIQNLANFKTPGALSYTFKRNDNNTDFETTDGAPIRQDGSNAIPLILNDSAGTILPTIGFIIEF
jgi:outer membrane cobalamin receptor